MFRHLQLPLSRQPATHNMHAGVWHAAELQEASLFQVGCQSGVLEGTCLLTHISLPGMCTSVPCRSHLLCQTCHITGARLALLQCCDGCSFRVSQHTSTAACNAAHTACCSCRQMAPCCDLHACSLLMAAFVALGCQYSSIGTPLQYLAALTDQH
jgi:hypothetical protein